MSLNKVIIMLICICGFLSSCEKPQKMNGEIVVLENLLIKKTTEIQKLRNKAKERFADYDGMLVHLVFFDLKSDLKESDIEQFTNVIESFKEIKSIEKIIYGEFLDVGDARSMDDKELVIQLIFKDVKALESYQLDSIHLKAKKKLKPFLASAPVTYDYKVAE